MNIFSFIKSLKPVSLVKDFRKIIGFPGLTIESCKHHVSVLPVHFFTMGGGVVCAIYLSIMVSRKDATIMRYPKGDITANEKRPIYISPTRTDLKGQEVPENRPILDKE